MLVNESVLASESPFVMTVNEPTVSKYLKEIRERAKYAENVDKAVLQLTEFYRQTDWSFCQILALGTDKVYV